MSLLRKAFDGLILVAISTISIYGGYQLRMYEESMGKYECAFSKRIEFRSISPSNTMGSNNVEGSVNQLEFITTGRCDYQEVLRELE